MKLLPEGSEITSIVRNQLSVTFHAYPPGEKNRQSYRFWFKRGSLRGEPADLIASPVLKSTDELLRTEHGEMTWTSDSSSGTV